MTLEFLWRKRNCTHKVPGHTSVCLVVHVVATPPHISTRIHMYARVHFPLNLQPFYLLPLWKKSALVRLQALFRLLAEDVNSDISIEVKQVSAENKMAPFPQCEERH